MHDSIFEIARKQKRKAGSLPGGEADRFCFCV